MARKGSVPVRKEDEEARKMKRRLAWDAAHPDALLLIFAHLPSVALARCSTVCVAWLVNHCLCTPEMHMVFTIGCSSFEFIMKLRIFLIPCEVFGDGIHRTSFNRLPNGDCKNCECATVQDCERVSHRDNFYPVIYNSKPLRSHEIFSVLRNVKILHLG